MKIIIKPILKFILWILAVIIGIIYSIIYFIYDPKEALKEKIYNLETTGHRYRNKKGVMKWETDWWATIKSYDFWCSFINS